MSIHRRNITITEKQYRFLKEGITYSKNQDGTVGFSINTNRSDKSNLGGNSADTRVFGTRHDILHGDGTAHGKTQSLAQAYGNRKATVDFYQSVIDYIRNGRKGVLKPGPDVPSNTVTAVKKWFDAGYSDDEIIAAATKTLNGKELENDIINQKYNRVVNDTQKDDDVTFRYNMGTVPGTSVKFIALYYMTDFNFSDAMKNGRVRQNGNTDKILGINSSERQKDGRKQAEIDVTYDNNGIKPNIANNFSLNGVKPGHFKQQYGMNGQGGYSSINQLLDKSIIYANTVLKKINFIPDFIVSAPSSSKYNDYYCHNLSNKMGVEYVKDFFKKNIVNVKFDGGRDTSEMLSKGFTPSDILYFENRIKSEVFNEIARTIAQPIQKFVTNYQQYFKNILTKDGRFDLKTISDYLVRRSYNTIISEYGNKINPTDHYLMQSFMANSTKTKENVFVNGQDVANIAQLIDNNRDGNNAFRQAISQMYTIIKQNINLLTERGYKINFDNKRFKITNFELRFRPYLHNVYVIADSQLNKNGDIFKRYQNAKILIFDEDTNSGATLKCSIDAINEKLPASNNQNLLCLVNAYSPKGR